MQSIQEMGQSAQAAAFTLGQLATTKKIKFY